MRNIVLCGFMGCGKTTVGKALADCLSAEFTDMDEYIENREGMTIPEIFSRFGEQGFRDREHKAVLELSEKRGIVLATGGGALAYERNVRPLSKNGEIVFLKLSFDECYRRIKDSDRPIAREKTREQLNRLYEERKKLYRSAVSHEIFADGAPEEIAGEIMKLLEYNLKKCPPPL